MRKAEARGVIEDLLDELCLERSEFFSDGYLENYFRALEMLGAFSEE